MGYELAAENGHLHVVEWLHENRREGCTTVAMNRAAGKGHLHVVEWLHENREEVVVHMLWIGLLEMDIYML
jgi:hypothetical protein